VLIPLHRERLNLALTLSNLDEPPGFAVLIDELEIPWTQDPRDPRIYGPENAEALSRSALSISGFRRRAGYCGIINSP
jgi:hypothetical protein